MCGCPFEKHTAPETMKTIHAHTHTNTHTYTHVLIHKSNENKGKNKEEKYSVDEKQKAKTEERNMEITKENREIKQKRAEKMREFPYCHIQHITALNWTKDI